MAGRNLNTDFDVSPYFDDYDEDKKYLKILFRPSFPVQARELTQLQTMLNNQIGRFGQSIYKDGTTVTGGSLSLTNSTSLKLNDSIDWNILSSLIVDKSLGSGYSLNDELLISNGDDEVIVRLGLGGTYSFSLINNVVPSGFFGRIITENLNVTTGASGAQFEVNVKISLNADPGGDREERPIFHVQGFSTKTSTDSPTIYGEYLTGTEFEAGDELFVFDDVNLSYGTSLGVLPESFSSTSLLASVSEGIFFTNNFFTLIDKQTNVVSKYDTGVSLRIGFRVVEDIVTEREDESLLDNAAGAPNENAPGAHRFKIRLQLIAKTISEANSQVENFSDEGFYEIGRVENGEIRDRQERPQYSVLGDELADRVFDVNGNFVIEPFKITFGDKLLWKMEVIEHDLISSGTSKYFAKIDASRDDLTVTDFQGKVFVVDDRIYQIVTATKNPEDADSVFTIEMSTNSFPSFYSLEGLTIDVLDRNIFELSFTSGKAYVSGRKFTTNGTTRKDLEKTRTEKHLVENEPTAVSVSYGNYLVLDDTTISGALDRTDFEIGSIFELYADASATADSIGTARNKQTIRGTSDTLELYFFDASFDSRTITTEAAETTSGTSITLSAVADAGVEGATFTYAGTRYRITDHTTGVITITPTLVTAIPASTDLTLNYSASAIKAVKFTNSGNNITAQVSSTILDDLDEDGYEETRVLQSDKTKLIFPVTEFITKDITNASYSYVRALPLQFNSQVADVTELVAGESLSGDNTEYFIQVTATNGSYTAGDIVDVDNISIDVDSEEITLTDVSYTGSAYVVCPIRRNPASQIETRLTYGNTKETTTDVLSATGTYILKERGQVRMPKEAFTTPGEFKSIGLSGTIRVRGIYELDGTETTTDFTTTDIQGRFEVDFGQRDEVLDHTKVALRAGYSVPENDILIIVDRIVQDTTDALVATYYSVDSYNELWYDILPKIESSDGQEYDLRQIIDFRPRVSELSDGSAVDLSTFTDDDKSYLSSGKQIVLPSYAKNSSVFNASIDYYVGRSDKVSITPELNIKIIEGSPNEQPEPPISEDRSLTLYDVVQTPYSTTEKDVETTIYDNRRFTMNDISKIDERLQQLEKTVQLDRVEKAILSSEIKDSTNTNLFKTGVFVDSFGNSNNADFTNPDYAASIDPVRGELRPSFDQYAFSMEYNNDDINSTSKITDDGILFPQYSDTPVSIVDQILATRTENVNPFAVMDWLGELRLTPSKDFWKDTVRAPDVIADSSGSNAAWANITQNATRTEWGNWDTRWSGFNRRRRSRTGTQVTVTSKLVTKSLGDSIVDQSVIPIMRSVPGGIRFRGISMKPNTNVFPFFDEQDIIDYIRPAIIFSASLATYRSIYESASTNSTITVNGETVRLVHKTKDINRCYFHLVPNSRSSGVYNVSDAGTTTLIISGTTVALDHIVQQKVGGSFRLKTDAIGSVSGIFDVPSGTFKTGTRNFKLIDTSTGDRATSNTSADRDFESSGSLQTLQEKLVTTRELVERRRSVSEQTTTTVRRDFGSPTSRFARWRDPLAETFLIDGVEFPQGTYLHSIDLWIVSRDPAVPITLQLRPVNNGYPDSRKIIPFSEVHLDPEEVTIAQTPAVDNYTRFTFSTPVFLQPGEYSFVVLANSVNYEVYTALMGEKVLSADTGLPTNRVMNEQPFAGVMFKSQNASTWTAYQEEDMMFRINRVDFIPGTYTAVLNAEFDKAQLEAIAPFKDGNDTKHFIYDPVSNGSKFSYNLFKINVPQIRDFDGTIDPVYEYKPWILTESTNSIDEGTFRSVEVNETIINNRTLIVEEDQPNAFQLKLTFGTESNIVAPFIDAERMNTIFIQNIVDEAEMNRDDITIIAPGSGYVSGDTVSFVGVDSGIELGQATVTASGITNSGVSDLTITDPIKYATNDIEIVTLSSSSGSGLEVKAQSEVSPNGGVASARYISKRVTLKAGFESQDMKVTLSAYRPEGTAIYVYYKVRAAEDTDLFKNKPWNLMYELSNPNEYSTDRNEFLPLEFVSYKTLSDGSVDPTTKGGTFYTYNGTTYESFNMYAVKIVMTSDTTYKTPIITSLGALALITPIEPQD